MEGARRGDGNGHREERAGATGKACWRHVDAENEGAKVNKYGCDLMYLLIVALAVYDGAGVEVGLTQVGLQRHRRLEKRGKRKSRGEVNTCTLAGLEAIFEKGYGVSAIVLR
jgi:hypothetical protein